MIIQSQPGTGPAPATRPPSGDLAPLTARWTYDSEDEAATVLGQTAGGPVLVASGDTYSVNSITALDPANGHVAWTRDKAFFTNLLPTLGPDNNLYGAAFDRNAITVRNGQTGDLAQTLDEPFAPNTRCAVGADGTIYVGGSTSRNDDADEALYAIDPSTGQEKWHFATHTWLSTAAPTIGPDNQVYCTTSDGQVVALDGKSGQPRWTFAAAAPIGQSVVVGPHGTVYAIDQQDTVYAIDPTQTPTDGQAQAAWTARLDTPTANPYRLPSLDVSQPLVVAPDNQVYAVASGQSVRALDGDQGSQTWEQPVSTYQPPVLDPTGTLLVYADDGAVIKLDPKAGQPVGEWCSADPISANTSAVPVVTNAAPGKLVAL